MSLADALRLAFLAIAVLGLLWTASNAFASWRYERRRLRLVSPKRPAVVIRFARRRAS